MNGLHAIPKLTKLAFTKTDTEGRYVEKPLAMDFMGLCGVPGQWSGAIPCALCWRKELSGQ